MANALYIGLMSGTSMDGIDAALLEIRDGKIELRGHYSAAISTALRDDITAISKPGDNEIERCGILDRQIGQLFARAALDLMEKEKLNKTDIAAIGSHGQTIRHRPPSILPKEHAFTLQIGDPNTIAEQTGITTVADFRRRDVAAGGEGAPLAPAFHNAAFRSESCARAIVNIGGISNVTLLNDDPAIGFDTGPGNTLLDAWIQKHKAEPFDRDGRWAASGQTQDTVLNKLLQIPYFATPPPKSTGKELFNLSLLEGCKIDDYAAEDIQATLAELSAVTIANSIPKGIEELYLCGGGAHNLYLRSRLEQHLPSLQVDTTETLGIHPDWVEAAAFAWLAAQSLNMRPGNLASVTGAAGERILGAIYPA